MFWVVKLVNKAAQKLHQAVANLGKLAWASTKLWISNSLALKMQFSKRLKFNNQASRRLSNPMLESHVVQVSKHLKKFSSQLHNQLLNQNQNKFRLHKFQWKKSKKHLKEGTDTFVRHQILREMWNSYHSKLPPLLDQSKVPRLLLILRWSTWTLIKILLNVTTSSH